MGQKPATQAKATASPPVPFQTDQLLTARQVAAITGLSRKRVAEAAAAGHLTTFTPPAGVRGLVKYGKRSAENLARSMLKPATSEAACDDA